MHLANPHQAVTEHQRDTEQNKNLRRPKRRPKRVEPKLSVKNPIKGLTTASKTRAIAKINVASIGLSPQNVV